MALLCHKRRRAQRCPQNTRPPLLRAETKPVPFGSISTLEAHKPKRGRKRTPDSISKRLEAIAAALPDADPVSRLHLVQERFDLLAELAHLGGKIDLTELESDFVASAKGYSDRRGISYAAWRELGVEAAVLKKAGI